MGLFDFLKYALGTEDAPVTPPMATITIISSSPATQTSENPSPTAQA
jgi:hypothetical protein